MILDGVEVIWTRVPLNKKAFRLTEFQFVLRCRHVKNFVCREQTINAVQEVVSLL